VTASHETRNPALVETFTYDDRIVRNFVWAMIVWAVVGLTAGVFIALQLTGMGSVWGPTWLNSEYTGFGRLRPLHTNAVIFAFTGNGIFAGTYYSLQRLCKTPMWSKTLSQFNFWGWQAIIVAAAITLPLGITSSKEYAELEWPIDIAITLVWVAFGINMLGTIFTRRERHLYVAIWFYIATWVGIAMLHIVNSFAVPVSLTKSYSLYAGAQDALVQWWYGHNAVAFFLTTPILGLMYYYIPKISGRPVYSYRLSIVHYWSLIFLYIWAGPHHLLHTSLPNWAQTLGTVFSIMLWAPSWGGMINGLLTLRGAFDKVRESPELKFLVCAVTFYGMATFEGPLLALREVNALSHNTDWTIGHVHSGALGWVGMMMFGTGYWLLPKVYRTQLYSKALANFHFWIATLGIVLYTVSMWVTGIMQGSMWFQFNDEGVLVYSDWMEFIRNSIPYYYMRAFGGILYLTGAVLCLYNFFRTVMAAKPLENEVTQGMPLLRDPIPVDREVSEAMAQKTSGARMNALHSMVEKWPFTFVCLTAVALAIGGLVEIVPNMIQGANTPRIATVKPYTPLEVLGRDLYIREGCVSCHTQQIRTLRAETVRFGDYSRAGEFIYDRPFLWGSKRTGPDLGRVGLRKDGPSGAVWHYRHTWFPARTTSGGGSDLWRSSIMPNYKHLYGEGSKIDFESVDERMRVLASLPTPHPYSAREIADAPDAARKQAREIARWLIGGLKTAAASDDPQADEPPVPTDVERMMDQEIIALTAYLLRLGKDLTPTTGTVP
jgi:cytochrome c oxidase cbb3-type subunit I/II